MTVKRESKRSTGPMKHLLRPLNLSSPSSSTSSAPPLSSPAAGVTPALPIVPSLAPPFFSHLLRFRWQPSRPHPRPHLRLPQEVQNRSCAPLICKQVPDGESILPSSCLLSHLRSQVLLLSLPFDTVLEEVFSCLHLVLTPPALRRVRVFLSISCIVRCGSVPFGDGGTVLLTSSIPDPPGHSVSASSAFHTSC